MARVLCKYRGALVIAEVASNPDCGKCPECGGATVSDLGDGWMECDGECGFAILKSDWERLTGRSSQVN